MRKYRDLSALIVALSSIIADPALPHADRERLLTAKRRFRRMQYEPGFDGREVLRIAGDLAEVVLSDCASRPKRSTENERQDDSGL